MTAPPRLTPHMPQRLETVAHAAPTSGLDAHAAHNRSLWKLLVVSLLLHAVGIGAYVFVELQAPPVLHLDDDVVKTHLVKLGKQRDEKLLPRLPTQAPPPPAESTAPVPERAEPQKETPEAEAQKKRSAADILEKFDAKNQPTDVNDLIKKRIGEPTDEGHEQGDAAGTDLTGSLQASYVQRLIAHIKARMQLSDVITDEERVRLKATIALRISAEGEVLDVRISESSGSTVYDNDVVAAVRKSEPVPAPPIQLRTKFAGGVGIHFCPISCS
jgi:TonB family protein